MADKRYHYRFDLVLFTKIYAKVYWNFLMTDLSQKTQDNFHIAWISSTYTVKQGIYRFQCRENLSLFSIESLGAIKTSSLFYKLTYG